MRPPPPSPSPPPSPPLAPLLLPLEPEILELRPACSAVGVRWRPAPAEGERRVDHFSVVVTGGGDGGGAVAARRNTSAAEATLGPLFSGATYGVRVQAANRKGASEWSPLLVTTTDVPTRAPVRPAAPIARASDESCGVTLELAAALPPAAADGGAECGGAEYVEVQARRAGTASWRAVLPRAVAATAMLDGLEPHSGYAFRLVAYNRAGGSAASEPSLAIVPGLPDLARAPSVRATSSASYEVRVPATAAACQAGLEWSIFVNIDGAGASAGGGDSDGGWLHLATAPQGSTYRAEQLRCARVCAFRLRPVLRHWDGAALDGAAVEAAPAPLPPLGAASARLEFELAGTEWNHFVRADLEGELRDELALGEAPSVVEAHVGARSVYVVLDISGGGGSGGATAEAATLRLFALLEANAAAGEVTRRIAAAAGVRRFVDGAWVPLGAGGAAGGGGGRHDGGGGAGPGGTLVLLVCVAVAAGVAAAWRGGWRLNAWGRRELRGAIPLSQDDMLDDERPLRADPRLLPINYPRRAAEADDAAEVLLVDDADGAGAETQYVNVRKDQRAKRAKGPKRFDPLERGAVLD